MKQHINTLVSSLTPRLLAVFAASLAGLLIVSGGAYAAFFTPTIRPNVTIAAISVGNLSYEQALGEVNRHTSPLMNGGLTIVIDGIPYTIDPAAIGLSYSTNAAVDAAWAVGRQGTPLSQAQVRATTLVKETTIPLPASFDTTALMREIDHIAAQVETPPKDVRLVFSGTTITIATDTASGRIIDRTALQTTIENALNERNPGPFTIALTEVIPSGTESSAQIAKQQAERVLKSPLVLTHERDGFTVTPETLATWLKSTVENTDVRVIVDMATVDSYLTEIDAKLNVAPVEPTLIVEDGQVKSFTAPRSGKALDREKTLQAIVTELEQRREEGYKPVDVTLIAKTTKPAMTDPTAKEYGIQELIGSATTDFSGSPKNRIWNIKTGARHLNYHLLAPGAEFSTTGTLGNIDAKTGYKPELVIKGTRTVPEYGGGLCQVSTTLFRSALNAGVPITARSNHAYRVGYYEKDGNGRYIGPGLDATIYSPNPDFRFKNDTPSYILITTYVAGTKITFNLYGTDDGRTAKVDGPHTLSTTGSGKPVYIETDTLAPGVKKQVETAHGGGSAIATYTVTYPDGTVKKNVFKSVYKNWPATYLVGKVTTATTPEEGTDTEAIPPATEPSAAPTTDVPPFGDPALAN